MDSPGQGLTLPHTLEQFRYPFRARVRGLFVAHYPKEKTVSLTMLPAHHAGVATHKTPVGGTNLFDPDSNDAVTIASLTSTSQPCCDIQGLPACAGEGQDSATGATVPAIPTRTPRPSLFDPALATLASLLDDIEGARKSSGNRLRILTETEPDSDGVMRGFGLDETHPAVAVIAALGANLKQVEHETVLALNRVMRKHPLGAWQKTQKGVGEKQLARLLGCIGDPYLREFEDGTSQPRTVSQLWAYCGLHTLPTTGHRRGDDTQESVAGGGGILPAGAMERSTPTVDTPLPELRIAAKRAKGQKANWSTDAKTRAYLIATSCIKQDGEYRKVYEARREHTAITHPDWTPGHSHNDGLRIVSKRILRDLWRAARDYHNEA